MTVRCSRCGAEATKQFGFTEPEPEPVCDKCFSAPGICSGCGKKFGSGILKIVGQNKNCPDCQERYEKEVDDLFFGWKKRS